jgi:hypothetical protein
MASASGVKAGEAYGELTLRDRMSKKLDAAKAKFMAFSRGMAVAGGAMMGVGGVVMGALAGPVRTFLDLGGSMQDASDRTGVSAEALSALGYAADQVGVSIEGLEGALKGMAKLTLGVKQGTKASADTLDRLGISSAAFLAATPTERLGMIADGLASIEDPSLRAALAMKALGRGGVDLLPLLNGGSAGMQALVDEAARMGVVLSSEDVAAADELGDALGGLLLQVRALAFSVGAALSGPLMTAVQFLREAAVSAITFAKNNQQLVQWLAAGAVAVTAMGAALLGLAGAGFVATGAISAVTAAMAVCSAVMAFVATPLFAIIVGVTLLAALAIAGVAAWMAWTESGQRAFGAIANGFSKLMEVAKTTFGAIADAVMAGNWELAMRAAVAGLNVIWLDFKTGLVAQWQTFVGYFADSWIMLKGVVASAISALPALLVGPFSTMQDYIVGWANTIAEALGLEIRFDGIDALRELSQGLNAEARKNQAKITAATTSEVAKAQASRQAKVITAGAEATAARVDLEKIRMEAAAGLAAKVEKGRNKVKLGGRGGGGGESPLVQPGGVLGTFSGAIAGMLSRSAPDLQEKIAANTERSADALEEIADQEGLAWE